MNSGQTAVIKIEASFCGLILCCMILVKFGNSEIGENNENINLKAGPSIPHYHSTCLFSLFILKVNKL